MIKQVFLNDDDSEMAMLWDDGHVAIIPINGVREFEDVLEEYFVDSHEFESTICFEEDYTVDPSQWTDVSYIYLRLDVRYQRMLAAMEGNV